MESASGRFVVVFNGEIYNFQELRQELTNLGHVFAGSSDTEVMLAGFEEWGVSNGIRKFNGMFAAALFDQKQQVLFIFRDRLGVKPLYYQWRDQTLYFSSELTAPFAEISEREIDRDALALYFRLNYIPAPYTIYKGIYKLIPGIIAIVTEESAAKSVFAETEIYWNTQERIDHILASSDESMPIDEAVELLESTFHRTIQQRMIADVPLGAFLSGGVDSSLVVAYMQKLSTKKIQTFTIGFNEEFYNEADHAGRVAEHLGTDHTELIITERDALEIIPKLPAMYGEPFADSSQIPTHLISKLTRQTITVALTGDGGDELFGGYDQYQWLSYVQRYLSLLPPSFYASVARSLYSQGMRRLLCSIFGQKYYEWIFKTLRLFARNREDLISRGIHSKFSLPECLVLGNKPGASVMPFHRCRGSIIEQVMCDDLMISLPNDMLTKVDRASMAVALEVRVPFVDDFQMFETAWKIPLRHKVNQTGGKIVLKKALARHVPPSLFERPKMGFGVPLARWLNGPLKDWVDDCVNSSRVHQEGYLNPVAVEGLTSRAAEENEWYAYKLWAVCIFQAWLREFHTNN
jgi:asparagine synthase (glutamine-hydrolysing)